MIHLPGKSGLKNLRRSIKELKDGLEEIEFRTPWTKEKEKGPVFFLILGAAIALLGAVLFAKRERVAGFSSKFGEKINGTWRNSEFKGVLRERKDRLVQRFVHKSGEPAPELDGLPLNFEDPSKP